MTDLLIYSNGFVHCSICVPEGMSVTEIESEVNLQNPSGTMNGWKVDAAPTFRGGAANPHPCERSPSRLHYLMVC